MARSKKTPLQIDPTTILRLHSILSDQDIFLLTRHYDYTAKFYSPSICAIEISDDLRKLVNELNHKSLEKTALLWQQAEEIQVYNWSSLQIVETLREVQNICQSSQKELLINIKNKNIEDAVYEHQ